VKRISKLTGVLILLLLVGCTREPTYIEKAAQYLEDGHYNEAVKYSELAIFNEEDVALAWRIIGMVRFREQNFAEASEALLIALENGGEKTPIIFNMLGVNALRAGNLEEAIEFFNAGLAIDVINIQDYSEVIRSMKINRIAAYEWLYDWEMAKQLMAEYVLLYPDDEGARREFIFLETR